MEKINPGKIKKILIRAPNWIGDAVLAIPALTRIRDHFKESEISILGPDSILQLLKENKIADRWIPLKPSYQGLGGKRRLIYDLKKMGFDLAILLQNAFEAAFITFLSSIPYRVGYKRDGRGFLLTHSVSPLPKSKKIHQLQYYLELLEPLVGVSSYWEKPFLQVTQQEKERGRHLLEKEGILENKSIIGMNVGAAYGSAKRWVPERFAQLGDRLIKETRSQIVFFGSSNEVSLVKTIQGKMAEPSFSLTGKTGIRELMGGISHCSLFITNDSGPMHIASALDIPVISIFGPTDDKTTSPVGNQTTIIKKEVECSPCLLRECPIDHRCMTSISVDEVFKIARLYSGAFEKYALNAPEPHVSHRQSRLLHLNNTPFPAVFLDRDGTINEDTNYVSSEDQFKVFQETPEAICLFNRMQIPVFIVSNQSGIERGYFTEALLLKLHVKLEETLDQVQAKIAGFYYCPHRPETGCSCRKPEAGLIDKILEKHPINLKKSYFVGDQLSDLLLAERLGAKGILVLSGKGKETLSKLKTDGNLMPAYVADQILDAARWICQDLMKNEGLVKSRHSRESENPGAA